MSEDTIEDPLRRKPYVWATWITKLLSGENKCWHAAWYKSRYKATKTPDDPDRADFFKEWTRKHDALIATADARYKKNGYVTKLEEQAEFKLVGKLADVAGKPDLVAMKDGRAVVVEGKAGRKRPADHWQVLIYLFGLPLSWTADLKLEGALEYADGEEIVRDLGKRERTAIIDAIRAVSLPDEPAHSPSPNECRYCDVAACQERYIAPEGDATRYF